MEKYTTNIILSQIQLLCNIRHGKGKLKETIISSGLKYSIIDSLRKGSMISADKLAIIGDALACSTDYLLGRASFPSLPDDIYSDMELSAEESEMIELYRSLNEKSRNILLSALDNNQYGGVHQEITAGRDNYVNSTVNNGVSQDDIDLLHLIQNIPLIERSKLIFELSEKYSVEKKN